MALFLCLYIKTYFVLLLIINDSSKMEYNHPISALLKHYLSSTYIKLSTVTSTPLKTLLISLLNYVLYYVDVLNLDITVLFDLFMVMEKVID